MDERIKIIYRFAFRFDMDFYHVMYFLPVAEKHTAAYEFLNKYYERGKV